MCRASKVERVGGVLGILRGRGVQLSGGVGIGGGDARPGGSVGPHQDLHFLSRANDVAEGARVLGGQLGLADSACAGDALSQDDGSEAVRVVIKPVGGGTVLVAGRLLDGAETDRPIHLMSRVGDHLHVPALDDGTARDAFSHGVHSIVCLPCLTHAI